MANSIAIKTFPNVANRASYVKLRLTSVPSESIYTALRYRSKEWTVSPIRKRVKMSQTEFARAYHISRRALQEWEQGGRQPIPPREPARPSSRRIPEW
jgi:DNA-binding transcriptional regulator YiaG